MKIVPFLWIIFSVHQGTKAKAVTDSETLALVSEPISGSEKRQLELLPGELPVDITSENQQTRLHLVKQKNIDIDKIKLTVLGSDLVERQKVSKRIVGYYQDRSQGAAIAITAKRTGDTILRTLEGTLVLNNKAYEIHPKTLTSYSSDIHEERRQQVSENVHILKEVDLRQFLNPDKYKNILRRKESNLKVKNERRASRTRDKGKRIMEPDQTTFHVEIKFLLDWTIYQHWLYKSGADDAIDDIKYFFVHIFNGMNMAYRRIEDDPKHNMKIILWLDEIIITKNIYESYFTYNALEGDEIQTKTLFDMLPNYRKSKGYTWNKPDHLSIWSRKDMVYGSTGIYGVADLCGICEEDYSTSVNHEMGFFSWTTGAHELAHILGSEHDGYGKNFCSNDARYLMTTEDLNLTDTLNGVRFSDCSINQMRDCITGDFDYGTVTNSYIYEWPRVCVYESKCEHEESITDVELLPGEVFSLNIQCNHINSSWGYNGVICPSTDICKSIRCMELSSSKCISHTSELKAAPGTKCDSNDSNKICYAGECKLESTIQTYSQNFKCSDEEQVPYGCNDIQNDCESSIKSDPYDCFILDWFAEGCAASCHKAGLYEADFSPCPDVTNEINPQPSIKKGFPMYCVPEYIKPPAAFYKENILQICLDQVSIRCPSDPSKCVSATKFCDLHSNDCPENDDETSSFCQKLTAGIPGYIRRENNPSGLVLERNCRTSGDASFQKYCQTAPVFCPLEFFGGINCPNNPSKCIPPHVACDGTNDCGATSEEVGDETLEFCVGLCSPGYFKCPGNGEMLCVPTTYACDGYKDCDNNGDEDKSFCDELKKVLGGSSSSSIACPSGKVSCPKSNECVYEDYLCDTIVDCYDKSDEDNSFCSNLPPAKCLSGYIPCPDFPAKCIPPTYKCDNILDCFDGSDEKYCITKQKDGSEPIVNVTRSHYHRH